MPKKPTEPKIRYVKWRGGRPRFEPSPTLRHRGYEGEDLKNADGTWLTEFQAREWSRDLTRKIEMEAHLKSHKRTRARNATGSPMARRGVAVGNLVADWLNANHNPDMADRRPNTLRDYRQKMQVLETRAPDIWRAGAEALDKPICIGLYDKLRREAGLHTAVAVLRVLGIALQWGMDRGRLPSMLTNPAHKLRMKTPAPRVRCGSPAEIEHLIATSDAIGRPELGDMVALAVWTGQRQADRLALTYAGRAKGMITLRQEKTKKMIEVPEAPQLMARLDAAILRRKKAEVISPLVILDEQRWLPFKPDYYRHLFDDLRRAASQTMPSLKTLRDQDFRDTAVTWLARADCTIFQICSITGHSFATATTIMNHYVATDSTMARTAMGKMVAWHEGEKP